MRVPTPGQHILLFGFWFLAVFFYLINADELQRQ